MTDTPYIISILIFYGLLAVFVPLINLEFNQSLPVLTWDGAFDIVTSFGTLAYYSITGFPLWLGIIFSIPAIVLIYLIARLLRGM